MTITPSARLVTSFCIKLQQRTLLFYFFTGQTESEEIFAMYITKTLPFVFNTVYLSILLDFLPLMRASLCAWCSVLPLSKRKQILYVSSEEICMREEEWGKLRTTHTQAFPWSIFWAVRTRNFIAALRSRDSDRDTRERVSRRKKQHLFGLESKFKDHASILSDRRQPEVYMYQSSRHNSHI